MAKGDRLTSVDLVEASARLAVVKNARTLLVAALHAKEPGITMRQTLDDLLKVETLIEKYQSEYDQIRGENARTETG